MLAQRLKRVRETAPLIHSITNYVTANDCANVLLACGASPIMADDPAEVEEITALCSALNINMGTLKESAVLSMLAAGKKANGLGKPVLLDPVGVGASRLRMETAFKLLRGIRFSVIRGNLSEIKALASSSGTTGGVDAAAEDRVTGENIDAMVRFAKRLSEKTGAVLAITGAIDLVADPHRVFCIRNGHPMMSRITGTGCQLSALTTAFLAANPDNTLEAATAAVCAMGLCGEIAYSRMGNLDGNASYRNYLMDAVYNLTPDTLERGANYEVR